MCVFLFYKFIISYFLYTIIYKHIGPAILIISMYIYISLILLLTVIRIGRISHGLFILHLFYIFF